VHLGSIMAEGHLGNIMGQGVYLGCIMGWIGRCTWVASCGREEVPRQCLRVVGEGYVSEQYCGVGVGDMPVQ
jgi:hypothetical protein